MEEALRFQEGKLRLDLVPTSLQTEVAKVMGHGAKKYEEENWRKGMKWRKCLASLKRHILDWENGIDFDKESGLSNISHAACNIAFLIEYHRTHPELDDRIKPPSKIVSLDIDDVVCSLVDPFCKHHNMEEPCHWLFDYEMEDKLSKLGEDFWLDLKPCFDPAQINFEISYYITARDPKLEVVTREWIKKNNFPNVPIIFSKNKGKTCKELGVQVHIDDSVKNFNEVNKEGIACFLIDRPWNRWKDVGYRRIKEVVDLNKLFV